MKVVLGLDDYDLAQFTTVAAQFGQNRFGYVVTPNVDHMIRYWDDPDFRELYADAAYVLLDSHFLSKLMHMSRGARLPVCAGSDLTRELVRSVIKPAEPVVLIGGSEAQALALQEKFGLLGLAHHNPPMGFIRSPAEVEKCLEFIERQSPFRFCFIAVGSPQQEKLAHQLLMRGKARGLALCVGASLNFLTGDERRAPPWMQRAGIEWCYRLMQDPRRLAKRYLVRGPRIFGLLPRMRIELRAARSPRVASLVSAGS